MESPRASVVIPAWNSSGVIERCLDSLERQRLRGGFETIVVDDASTDDTPTVLRRYADRVRVIARSENAGFSATCNEGAREARGPTLVFLNADTELLGPDALATLVAAADRAGVGIAGPLLVNPDGTLQPSCAADPGIANALLLATGLWRLLPDRLRIRFAPQFWSHDRALDVDWLLGAVLAVRADAFRASGGFWPTPYAQEQELAHRVRERGFRVRFEPGPRVMHVGNHSFAQRWSEADRSARVARANLAFLEAHYTRPRAAAIRAITLAGYAARAIAHAALGRRERAQVFRGMARVYAGRDR